MAQGILQGRQQSLVFGKVVGGFPMNFANAVTGWPCAVSMATP